jgi:hypothetical protein
MEHESRWYAFIQGMNAYKKWIPGQARMIVAGFRDKPGMTGRAGVTK